MEFFTTLSIASSIITIAEQKSKLEKTLNKIIHYISKGKCIIIIFGAGGTGKTTLSYVLTDNKISDYLYNETANIEKVKLNSDIWGHFLVAPGQERRVERYWPELFRKLGAGKIAGIINVVSYGYHSIDIKDKSYKNTKYYIKERESFFLNDYIKLKRHDEINYLKKVAEHIKNTDNKFWMITLVNKQDLWWDEREKVESYYTEGEYDKIIQDIYSTKGTSNFVHEYISCALFNCNFKIGSDFEKQTVKGYDEPLRQSNYNNFVNLLNRLIHE